MNSRRSLPLLVALGAASLAACNDTPAARQPATSASAPAPAPAPGATTGSASVKAFIDPATGELRAPTEAEQKAAAASAAESTASADLKATGPIEGKPIGNGVVEFEVGKRGMVDEVACVQADGSVTTRCPPASHPK